MQVDEHDEERQTPPRRELSAQLIVPQGSNRVSEDSWCTSATSQDAEISKQWPFRHCPGDAVAAEVEFSEVRERQIV